MTEPLVTAICPTLFDGRTWCLPLAAAALGSQRGLEPPLVKLLIGIDEHLRQDARFWCVSPVEFIWQRCSPGIITSVRVVDYPAGLSLGDKRMALCRQADTEWIAHWDDDDWKAPGYLAAALSLAATTDAELVGSPQAYFVDLQAWKAYEYKSDGKLLVGTSLVYRQRLTERIPIPARDRGEDTMFVDACRKAGVRIATLPDHPDHHVVAFQHGQSTGRDWPPRQAEYTEVPMERVRALMGDDLDRWAHAYGYGGA